MILCDLYSSEKCRGKEKCSLFQHHAVADQRSIVCFCYPILISNVLFVCSGFFSKKKLHLSEVVSNYYHCPCHG